MKGLYIILVIILLILSMLFVVVFFFSNDYDENTGEEVVITSSEQLKHAEDALNWLKLQQDSSYKNSITFSIDYDYDYTGEVSGKVDITKWQDIDFEWQQDPYFTIDGVIDTSKSFSGKISGTWGGTEYPEDYVIKVFAKTDSETLQAIVELNPNGSWGTDVLNFQGELKAYLFDQEDNIVAYPNEQQTISSDNYQVWLYRKTDKLSLLEKLPLYSDGSFISYPQPRYNDDGDIRRFVSTAKSGDKVAKLVNVKEQSIIDSTEAPEYNLIRSKYIPEDDPLSGMYGLDERSWIYSDAVAIIAFSIADEHDRANNIIKSLQLLQNQDGSLYFSYDINTGKLKDYEEIYSGSLAWVGYSVVFYEEKYKEGIYIEFAKRIADYLLTLQVTDQSDLRYGSIKGGFNSDGTPKTWVSTEHNIDSYFFLRDLGYLTGIQKYTDAAELVKNSLVTYHWNTSENHFQRIDSDDRTLDSNSWGGIFAQAIGREDMVEGAATFVKEFEVTNQTMKLNSDTNYYNMTYQTDVQLTGFKPYLEGGNYSNTIDEVWAEGTLGVINEMLRRGEDINIYLKSMFAMQDADSRGGLVSSNHNEGEFHIWPSVADAAWLYIDLVDYDAIWTPDR